MSALSDLGKLHFHIFIRHIRSTSGLLYLSPLEQGVIEGENPVWGLESAVYDVLSTSRVVWDCSPNLVANFI